ncbi:MULTISPECIES: MraY family glycosyltransferase [Kocuria]|uniref:Glycosyltransferase family 4 protein n=1 Tax=Kocuria subflava TaxID=1736139 RepID=A0A846U0S8_9MICC|nr:MULTISPECIES: glycosyltransferase family 4 protein [Kocuria]NKE10095.1 glycosyltransferase family 4 protein [Kocuria subflava]
MTDGPSVLSVDPGSIPTVEELQHLLVLAVTFGAAALVLSVALPFVVKPLLTRWGVVDIPNERSSHTRTVIRGMGLAVAGSVITVQAAGLATGAVYTDRSVALIVLAGTAACAALGWAEDFKGVSVRVRLLIQALVGGVCSALLIWTLETSLLWWVVCTGAVVVYVNVANFMDGINGISGLHGLVVGLLYAWAGASNDLTWMIIAGLVVAFAFAGFLPWNLSRGAVFLGDVGSYLLGGSIILIAVAAFLSGVYVEYLLPPLSVYLADTSWTLLRRYRAGEAWWRPHRQHAYQRLTDVGLTHVQSSAVVALTTVLVSVVSLLGLQLTGVAVLLAGILVILILVLYLALPWLLGRARRRTVVSGDNPQASAA